MNYGYGYKTDFLWVDSTLRKYENSTEDDTDKVGCKLIKIEPRDDVSP